MGRAHAKGRKLIRKQLAASYKKTKRKHIIMTRPTRKQKNSKKIKVRAKNQQKDPQLASPDASTDLEPAAPDTSTDLEPPALHWSTDSDPTTEVERTDQEPKHASTLSTNAWLAKDQDRHKQEVRADLWSDASNDTKVNSAP